MRVLNLSYQHAPDLPGHQMLHLDISQFKADFDGTMKRVLEFAPELWIDREWNDSIAIYPFLHDALPGVRSAFWHVDAHVNWDRTKEYDRRFDYLFFAVSRYVGKAKRDLKHPNAYWLPLCWSHGPITINTEPKTYPVSFVCRWTPEVWFQERIRCIGRLREHFGERAYVVNSADMISIVRQSRVSMNHCYNNDLNYRHFEVLGCGTELVTSDTDDIHRIPGMTDRVTIYRNLDEMIELTEAVLAGEIQHDMFEVQNWVARHHDVSHRYKTIIDTVLGKAKGYEEALPYQSGEL